MSNSSSPALHPNKMSSNSVSQELQTKKEAPAVASRYPPLPALRPGQQRVIHTLADGGKVTVTKRMDEPREVTYVLDPVNGSRVVLEKKVTSISLVMYDKEGKTRKTLGCEL